MLFVWILILGLVQSAASLNINFLALLAIFAGLKKGPLAGFLIAILIGAFAEVLSSSAFGLNLAIYSMLGLLSGIIKERFFYKETIIMEFLFSFFGISIFYMAYFVFTKTIQTDVFFTIIFSALVSPLLFKVIDTNPTP
jgi:cell shape-determining protein MreD